MKVETAEVYYKIHSDTDIEFSFLRDPLAIVQSSQPSWYKCLLTASLAIYIVTLILNQAETENNK